MDPSSLRHIAATTVASSEDVFLNTRDHALLDAEIRTHEDLLHHLTQRIAALKNHRNSLSPTSRLPMEVLSEIMLVSSHQSIEEGNRSDVYPTSLPLPLTLGHVCAAWRTLAWRLPGLWSTIPLALVKGRYEKQVVLLDEWLARAGEHQDLYIILTLQYDYAELQYWRDYPPEEMLGKLYKRSRQWHTFYSNLPNLCFDSFAQVQDRLPRLHTLILNRSGRMGYEVFLGFNNFAAGIPGNSFVQGGGAPGTGAGGTAGGVPISPDMDSSKTNPWRMLSTAPSLRTVVLPEALAPSEISLPYSQLTHLEVRTIPIDDCLRVLEQTPLIVSFDFYGIYSGPATFHTTSHIRLPDLKKFSIFSHPANLSRFLDSLTAPKLYSVKLKSTTGTLTIVTSQLSQLSERSGCRLRKLRLCIPSVGKCEQQIVGFLRGQEMNQLEKIVLESWQTDVEGLSNGFLERMNPERRVRTVRRYSYALPSEQQDSSSSPLNHHGVPMDLAPGWLNGPMDEVREVQDEMVELGEGEDELADVLLPNLMAITYKGTLSFNPGTLKEMLLARWRRKPRIRVAPKLDCMHYSHAEESTVQLPLLLSSPEQIPPEEREEQYPAVVVESAEEDGLITPPPAVDVNKGVVSYEEEEWFPTTQLATCEIYAPDSDFKEPIDEETSLGFGELVKEGFNLRITTRKGLLAFS